MILLIALPLALMRSCGSIAADVAPPPDMLVLPCQEPQGLPVRTLTLGEAEVFWGRDRGALRDCGDRHGLLVEWAWGQVGRGERPGPSVPFRPRADDQAGNGAGPQLPRSGHRSRPWQLGTSNHPRHLAAGNLPAVLGATALSLLLVCYGRCSPPILNNARRGAMFRGESRSRITRNRGAGGARPCRPPDHASARFSVS